MYSRLRFATTEELMSSIMTMRHSWCGLGAQGRPGLCRELVDDGRRSPEVTREGGMEPSELLDLVRTKLLDAVATKLDREALGEQARAFCGSARRHERSQPPPERG